MAHDPDGTPVGLSSAVRREAWPALVSMLAWGFFLAACLDAGYRPGQADGVAPLILAGAPLAASASALGRDRRNAAGDGSVPGPPVRVTKRWRVRLAISLLLALLLAGFAYELVSRASFTFDLALDPGPISPVLLLPGPPEAWAYVVAAALTTAALAHSWRTGLAILGALGATAVVGAAALLWFASTVAAGPYPNVSCRDSVGVALPRFQAAPGVGGPYFYAAASGELDGSPLGSAVASRYPGGQASVSYDTRWGRGVRDLAGAASSAFRSLGDTLSAARLVTAEDLGVDAIEHVPARHCRVVIDGRSAVAGFVPLRWLVGEDETTPVPGAGLGAWRGLLDYWIVAGEDRTGGDAGSQSLLALASVGVDGLPPGWRFPGAHGALRAWLWSGYTSGFPRAGP